MGTEDSAFDSSLGIFQGRRSPQFAAAGDSAPVTDLVAPGSTASTINLKIGGLSPGVMQGRLLQIGNETRKITSNTAASVTVSSAFSTTPVENDGVTIKGGEFVWTLGFDFRDRREHFAFGDGIQIENHLPLTGIAFLQARIWIKQPGNVVNQRTLTSGAVIIPNSSSVVTNIVQGLPAVDDFAATGSTTTTIQLTVGGLTPNAYVGRSVALGDEIRLITSNSANTVTASVGFPAAPAPGAPVHIIEQGPLITTQTPHYVDVGDMIAVSNVVWTGTPAFANRPFAVRRVLDPSIFELEAPATGSGTYAGGGDIGLRERFRFPAGLTEDDVGRYVLITNAANAQNNGLYRLVGIRPQPNKNVVEQAWFERTEATHLQGIVTTGSTTTVINVASPTLTSSAHVGRVLLIKTTAGTAEERPITANTTNTITVSPAFSDVPQTSPQASNFLIKAPVVHEIVGGSTVVLGKGARWRVSLLVKKGDGSWMTCARAVQHPNQSGFYRTDLRAYVKGVTADRVFAVRLEMIEHTTTDIYPL